MIDVEAWMYKKRKQILEMEMKQVPVTIYWNIILTNVYKQDLSSQPESPSFPILMRHNLNVVQVLIRHSQIEIF